MKSPNQLVQCWVSNAEQMPDLCCVCGVFTDKRTKIKHDVYEETKSSSNNIGNGLLRFFLFFLGPIGWIFSLLIRKETDSMIVKKKTVKLPIALCILCDSEYQLDILDVANKSQFLILVHPEFKKQLEAGR